MGANNQPIGLDRVREVLKERHCTLVSDVYVNKKTKLKYVCDYHPNVIQETTWECLRNGAGCKLCGKERRSKAQRYSYDFVKQSFEDRGYELLSTNYTNCKEYLEYRCPNHPDKIQKITFDAFIRGQGCYYCGVERAAVKKRVSESRAKAQCKKLGLEYCGLDTSQRATRVLYICPNHRDVGIQTIVWDSLKAGHGCKFCKESHGERDISLYLDALDIVYNREYKFVDCVDKHPLPFDFYIPHLNVAIEYDGEQHYQPSTFGTKDEQKVLKIFQTTQYHDQIKTQYCQDNGIKLIRIPYWEKDNIESILKKELNICKI